MSYAYQNDYGMGYSKNSAYGSNYYDTYQTPNSRPANIPLPLTTLSPFVQTPSNPQPVNAGSADATPVSAAASQVARSDNPLAPRGPSEIDVEAAPAPLTSPELVPAVWVADLELGVEVAPYDQSLEPDDCLAPVETEQKQLSKKGEVLAGAVSFDASRLDAGVEEFLSELDKLADEVVNAITADRVAHWMIITAGAAAAFEFARNGTRPPATGEPALIEGWREQIRRRLSRPLRGREVPP